MPRTIFVHRKAEPWESGPRWRDIVVEPVFGGPMAPRHARQILEVCSELMSQGWSALDILRQLEELYPVAASVTFSEMTDRIVSDAPR